jgi:CRP-like cAMP-binding protein
VSLTLSAADEALVLSTPLFGEIGTEATRALINSAYVTVHESGGWLFSRGDEADRFFVVLGGRVNLFALTEAGEQSIIEVIEAGHTFAEAAIFASKRFPLNGEAAPGTRLLEIPAQNFLHRLAEGRGLTAGLLASLARWQRRLLAEIGDLKGRNPLQRLGLFLLAMTDQSGEQREAGSAELHLPLTRIQLASHIGITPESLSRALGRLRPLGVEARGRAVIIKDLDGLRRFCSEE